MLERWCYLFIFSKRMVVVVLLLLYSIVGVGPPPTWHYVCGAVHVFAGHFAKIAFSPCVRALPTFWPPRLESYLCFKNVILTNGPVKIFRFDHLTSRKGQKWLCRNPCGFVDENPTTTTPIWAHVSQSCALQKSRSRCDGVAEMRNRLPALRGARFFFGFPCSVGITFFTFATPLRRA